VVTGEKAEIATTDAATTVAVNFILFVVVWILGEGLRDGCRVEIVRRVCAS
jgi:hypothetical protein